MNINSFILGNLPLGLDAMKILLHLFNFLLLLGGTTLLVYKPVKKFLDNRQQEIQKQYEDNEKAHRDAERLHSMYLDKMEKSESEIMAQRTNAERAIHLIKENAVSEANQKAEEIILKAEQESEEIKKETISSIKDKVSDVAISIATALIEREISAAENESIINNYIAEWTEDD